MKEKSVNQLCVLLRVMRRGGKQEKIQCDLILQMQIIAGRACSKGQLSCSSQYGYVESSHH